MDLVVVTALATGGIALALFLAMLAFPSYFGLKDGWFKTDRKDT